ncbi:helix-turn-helix transcriptional regulator [Isoptericola hypogeus]|uniref:Helix-turn-helix transcriptional regulator n=1 Tax=Isoptericola hypogeus TaxID=300179 RepID=A0ABP4VR91_9MICO
MAEPAGTAPTLVGRAPELDRLTSLLAAAAQGEARTVLVLGDAGVGKTSLVESALAATRPRTVLRGPCLPFHTISIPFLPLREAVRGSGVAGPPGVEGDLTVVGFDDWLTELGRVGPLVLFVDDLQWADSSSLDALLYLVAGPRRRPHALVVTVRSGEDAPERPVRRWLADARRMPGCAEIRLDPLDRIATAQHLAALLGGPVHESLVEEVYARSHGNPYFTRLLAAGLPADARHVPSEYTDDLRDAVMSAWYRLGPHGREVAEVLAAAGAPAQPDVLAGVCGWEVDAVHAALGDGAGAGLLAPAADGAVWFRHPLSAEVLESSLERGRRRDLHRDFALLAAEEAAASERQGRSPDVRTVVAVADHEHRAGDPARAYAAALRAADAAGAAGGAAEQQRLLARALGLHPAVPDTGESRRELLERSGRAARGAGLFQPELEIVDALLELVDPEAEPLVTARLLVRRMHLEYSTGRAFMDVPAMREAVRLSAAEPRSGTHALALAELYHAGMWHEVEGLEPAAVRALEIARAAGDDGALTYALTANAIVAVLADDVEAGVALGREAAAVAARTRDWWAYLHAVVWEANGVETWASTTYSEIQRRYREQMVELGAPHAFVAHFSADEAMNYLAIGDWRGCVERLRVAIASNPGPVADIKARLAAARLAALQGRSDEASAHLARAEDQFADLSAFVAFEFDAVRAEVRLAAGDAEGAFDAAWRGLTGAGPAPTMAEWLVPLALRALADLADGTSAERLAEGRYDVVERVDRFRERFPRVVLDFGASTPLMTAQISGLEALSAAEEARARHADAGGLWVAAADRLAAGGLPWEEAYACRRGAEAFLAAGARAQGVPLLRRGLAAAERLQAAASIEALRDLAARARVTLGEPTAVDLPDEPIAGLTARELEVLSHLAVGRTYAEIADALTISEKTVSTHVSHMLAKTGTRNRVELSGLVRRRR